MSTRPGKLLLLLFLAIPMRPQVAVAQGNIGTIQNFGPNLQTFANGICRQPEGIAVDPDGNVYASSNSDTATEGHICVLNSAGTVIDVIAVPTGPSGVVGLLGELWRDGQLFVLDQADNVAPNGRLLRINPRTHAVTTVATGFAFPNALAQDSRGLLYLSDSFQGRVYVLTPSGSRIRIWSDDPLLTSSNPDLPVGANGLAFDRDERFLYVANTGDRRVLRIPLRRNGRAGPAAVFADGASIDQELGLPGPSALFAADGIQFDVQGNLYVMANQVNEVQVLSPAGQLIHRFAGSGADALDFNASLVFRGTTVYITNMSAADAGINSKLSRFRAPFPGLPLN
jgi:sugar lactone lactonase YvrE